LPECGQKPDFRYVQNPHLSPLAHEVEGCDQSMLCCTPLANIKAFQVYLNTPSLLLLPWLIKAAGIFGTSLRKMNSTTPQSISFGVHWTLLSFLHRLLESRSPTS
jgi:hypothetical protein